MNRMRTASAPLLIAAMTASLGLLSLGSCAVLASANNQHTGGDGCVGRGFLAVDLVALAGTGIGVAASGAAEDSKAWLLLPGTFAASLLLGVIEANGCASSGKSASESGYRRTPKPSLPEAESGESAAGTTPTGLGMRGSKTVEEENASSEVPAPPNAPVPLKLRLPTSAADEDGKGCHERGYSCPEGHVCQQGALAESLCVPRPDPEESSNR